jgi:hypothetical protein
MLRRETQTFSLLSKGTAVTQAPSDLCPSLGPLKPR